MRESCGAACCALPRQDVLVHVARAPLREAHADHLERAGDSREQIVEVVRQAGSRSKRIGCPVFRTSAYSLTQPSASSGTISRTFWPTTFGIPVFSAYAAFAAT